MSFGKGMETLPELSNPPKKSDFENRVSLGYVGPVDSGFFGADFQFCRVLLIPKHKTIIMKENNNLYLEGYNGKSDFVLLSSKGRSGQVCST